ncbi:MAG: nitrate reductase cytochrome c-type subunit [Acidobacteria bacterium]|nr:nitrate reductase cytochrome c-type subunit [Acidobacteriota bacterium]
MKWALAFVAALTLLAAPVAGQGPGPSRSPDRRDTAVASADQAPAPEHFEHGDKRPGQSERLPRAWEGAPPVIPHSLRGLTPITAKNNACARCHGRAGATSGPPPAPPSHFVDLREAPGVVRPQIAASRYNCTACHVPQTNAPPLRRHSSDGSRARR